MIHRKPEIGDMKTYEIIYQIERDENGEEISRKVFNCKTNSWEQFTQSNYQDYVIPNY